MWVTMRKRLNSIHCENPMQAIKMRTVMRNIARFSRDRKARLYCAACVCLLMVAVGLRFHALPEHYLWYDEAAAANFSRGTFSEIISNTRRYNSAPILYPLALWGVQKVNVSVFSVRVLPAMASVLTVAVILLVLPRLGVARGAALLAAIFATLSVEAIRHAQDAREYSMDALLAVLMTAGLLWHLRDGRKALLCTSLFLAPLLQYGLVLFGAAVLGTALVFPPHATLAAPEWNSGRIRNWLKPRIALVWPAACFLAGSTVSYLMTLRYQWQEGGWASESYLLTSYYQGPFDAPSLFGFAIDRLWNFLTYHLPEVVAIAALPAFAILLVVAFRSKLPDSALAVLFSFCMAVSVGAAVLGLYPLGGIRQGIYLGPIVFLAVGLALHWTAGGLAALTRRTWLAPAMAVTAGGAIALAGVSDIWGESDWLYLPHDKSGEILAVLEERMQEEDGVYVFLPLVMQFHQAQNPIGKVMIDGDEKVHCRHDPETCFQEMIAAISPQAGRGRLWVVAEQPWHATDPELRVLHVLAAHVSVEHVVAGGMPNLYLIEDTEALLQVAAATDMLQNIEPILPRQPTVRATFDLYLREDVLIYVKKPCGAEEVQAPFFLHVDPADASDLPVYRRQYGFDNLDFHFHDYSLPLNEGCVAVRALPDYPIIRLHTGQYTDAGPVWEESLLHRERVLEQAGEPVIHSIFDVHRYENQLLYVKEPCAGTDTEAPFFLHVDPVDGNDLPADRRRHGFDNLDFDWNGERRDGQCRAIVKLPEYAIAGIRTGQYVGEEQIWKGEFLFVE